MISSQLPSKSRPLTSFSNTRNALHRNPPIVWETFMMQAVIQSPLLTRYPELDLLFPQEVLKHNIPVDVADQNSSAPKAL